VNGSNGTQKNPMTAQEKNDDRDDFARLFPFNQVTALSLILGGSVASFFLFGFWYPYWRAADMDFVMVYNAWLLNAGLPQEYFDHPGYLTIVILSLWFKLLHAIGALDVHALSALPAASDTAEYANAWTVAVQSARLASLAVSLIFVTTFYFLLQRLLRDRRVAVVAAAALAFSGGLAMHARIVRTELLAAALTTIAILVLLIAAETPRMRARVLLLGLASTLATLALENKVQALLVICALPVIVLPFGCRCDRSRSFWRDPPRALPLAGTLVSGAVLLAWAAAPLVALALSPGALSIASLRPLTSPPGAYQVALVVWIGLGILAFAAIWDVPALESLAAVGAIVAGCALGLLALELFYLPRNIIVVLNPVETLFMFAAESQRDLRAAQSVFSGEMARHMLEGFLGMLARRTFILQSSPRPTIFLEWLVIAGTIIAHRRGERRLALQAGVLLATVWGIDTISMLRGLKTEYFIFTDPIVVIAAALLLARLAALRNHRWTYPIGVTLIAAHVIVSQAEPVKHLLKRSGPEGACDIDPDYFKRMERFPFCAARRSHAHGHSP
jgi:hypothetical protein